MSETRADRPRPRPTPRAWPGAAALLTLLALLTACGPGPSTIADESEATLLGGGARGDFAATRAEAERLWAQRADRAALEAALARWEAALDIEAGMSEADRRQAVYEIYVALARGYFTLGDSVLPLSVDDPDAVAGEMEAAFVKGRAHAERAMAVLSPAFHDALSEGESVGDALEHLDDPRAVGALYWWASNTGRWLLFQGNMTALGHVGDIEAAISRAAELDPAYYHHGPLRYLGGYRTKMPWPGGDLPAARAHFERALAGSPEALSNRVSYAELYAVAAEDRALFDAQLRAVIDAPVGADADLAPENQFEKQKAARLLERADELF